MPKGSKKKFNYNVNRRKLWKKARKMPSVKCEQIAKAWDQHKSVNQNLMEMGVSSDPNRTVRIPKVHEFLGPKSVDKMEVDKQQKTFPKGHVITELMEEANLPFAKRVKLSEPMMRYCTQMMDKYGEDYKAMARDKKNHYQDTPKQIKKKITLFKQMPEQYNAYLARKKQQNMETSSS